ncbi:type I glutamate--ammonia ligase [Wielerella bovis]|uniref:type I glutamate--ammonia ligase n=1 Tax=Wielerella bovis TaxID=2917790 RepID=UPI002018BCEC|nr:type I glutamate--ammonia ligase [Wielerella bovis]ULJ61262.1 type I glutamate--ammonia ligase [Wielerella bovis]ULJ70134.1 type I glutamate--ammonia ligase [Wielerella bovis]
MSVKKVVQLIEDNEVRFVDLRFTDTKGKQHHFTIPARVVLEDPEEWFEHGHPFDGSSMGGWKGVQASDMQLRPDPTTAYIDPFYDDATVVLTCDVIDPADGKGYDRDPRSIARRAENYLKSTGIGDTAFFGPEPEFFVFDGIEFETHMHQARFEITSETAAWSSGKHYDGQNTGHRPMVKGGYSPIAPVDQGQDLRSAMVNVLEEIGIPVEVHHGEVGTGSQMELGTKFSTLVKRADWTQDMKYVIWNVAHNFGKTATFMPKPLMGDNGSGMHVHQSIWKDGKNLFSGDGYAGLSEMALYYIGGIIKHAKALNAITNPSTNSYKRLVPHFEAPVKLAYSAKNRSASIRIPAVSSTKAMRIEARFPDPTANPYLCFAALLMAGLDGIQNKIHPGDPATKNLYDLPPEEDAQVPTVCASLEEALQALKADHEFLLRGGVFSQDWIDSYIAFKSEDVRRMQMAPHPLEFEMYYSL